MNTLAQQTISKVSAVKLVFRLIRIALGRFEASARLAAVIIGCVLLIPQQARCHPASKRGVR